MKEEIKRLKLNILLKEPFFAPLFSKVKFDTSTKDAVAYTDGMTIFLGNKFKEYSEKYGLAIVMHELLHIAFLHIIRARELKDENRLLWNIATDTVINELLSRNGYSLPEGSVDGDYLEKEFDYDYHRDDTAEKIYNELLKKIKEKDKNKIPESYKGDLEPILGGSYDDSYIAEIKQAVIQGMVEERMRGVGRGNWSEVFNAYILKFNWLNKFRMMFSESFGNVYFSNKLHKKKSYYFDYDVIYYKPKMRSSKLYVVLDTSGSMETDELRKALSYVRGMIRNSKVEVDLILHDYELLGVKKLNRDFNSLELEGGGGTSYIPVLKYLESKKPSLVVWFTDGYGDQNREEFKTLYKKQKHEFIWVIMDGGKVNIRKNP